jgi:hypothetical protein
MTDEYAQHLRDVHSKLATPEEFILEALKDVTAGGIVSKRRIIAGEANEVYDIRTSDERDLIVRISRDREKDFEQERWAIDQCMKRDVPVPTILAIKHFSEGADPIDICIQDKLAGDLLSIAAASLPRDRVRDICVPLHRAWLSQTLPRRAPQRRTRRKNPGRLGRGSGGDREKTPPWET